jgi:hypothetical protein
VIANNTIVNNSVASWSPIGSAIYEERGGGYQVVDNLLVGPLVPGPTYSAVYCENSNLQFPMFSSNDAFTPSGDGFSGVCSGQTGPNDNISVDPLFVNPAGDFCLQLNSLAIDAGTNAAPNLPQTDLDNKPRILDGNNDCVGTVDMGAYEVERGIASVSFSADSLTFPAQVRGTSSNPQSVRLINTGAICFQFSGIGTTGDFSQINTCSADGLLGGASCSFVVTFSPTAVGTRLGLLSVSGTDGITSASSSVSLSGVGAYFSVSAAPTSASAKRGQSVKFIISINPVGGTFTSAVTLSCSGLPSKASCPFSPASMTPGENGATSVMTVSTSGNTPRDNYSVLVTIF